MKDATTGNVTLGKDKIFNFRLILFSNRKFVIFTADVLSVESVFLMLQL